MSGGHSAKRKSLIGISARFHPVTATHLLGGPDMYSVAKRALVAGLAGKRMAKSRVKRLDVCGVVASL